MARVYLLPLQYSQITDNIYETFMMARGRADYQLRIYLPCGPNAQRSCAPLIYIIALNDLAAMKSMQQYLTSIYSVSLQHIVN